MAAMCKAGTCGVNRLGPLARTACLLVLSAGALHAALPAPDGYVNDFAGVIDSAIEARVDALLRGLEAGTSVEIALVTVASLEGQTVERYASDLFNTWGIGKKREDNGVLVLVSPSDRAMRIEVGYGLEPVLPDGLAGEIVRTSFLPPFREGDYGRGILDGVQRIVEVVQGGAPARAVPVDGAEPPWLFIPFVGLFVGGGAFAVGVALRARTYGLLLWGVLFAAIPLVMAFVEMPVAGALVMLPLAAATCTFGFRKAAAPGWRVALRGRAAADTGEWTTGAGADSSGGGSSSGSSFGGGSSGGGGASGRW